jgi:hypothetical protein
MKIGRSRLSSKMASGDWSNGLKQERGKYHMLYVNMSDGLRPKVMIKPFCLHLSNVLMGGESEYALRLMRGG